ncbi:MAG TPA: hypothetical protein PLL06_19600, partial [Acidobacteriota bacterium]|nr:hypothetical protein [Acidobacteriota bacterium]
DQQSSQPSICFGQVRQKNVGEGKLFQQLDGETPQKWFPPPPEYLAPDEIEVKGTNVESALGHQ